MKKIIALLLVMFLSLFCITGIVSSNMTLDPADIGDVTAPDSNTV